MSDIRGPTSALTSFLRDKNIRIPNANRFRRRDAATTAAVDAATAAANEVAASGSVSRTTQTTLDGAVAALQAEADTSTSGSVEASASSSATSISCGAGRASLRNVKRKSPLDSATPSEVKRGKARKGLSMNFDEEDDDDDDDDDEEMEGQEYRRRATAAATIEVGVGASIDGDSSADLSKWFAVQQGTAEGTSRRLTAAGSVDNCAGCPRRFSITGYTVQTASGGLCHKCGPEYNAWLSSGVGGRTARTGDSGMARMAPASGYHAIFSSTSGTTASKPAPRKKKILAKPQDQKVLPNLQAMCINIISDYIEDVEALGGIGRQSIDALSKSISKNRRLNPQTVQLFLEADITQLSLYDCSKLDDDSLGTIANFSPRLRSLNLQLCGQLANTALDEWSSKLHDLCHVELYGPYLVRSEAWHRFFERIGKRLKTFKIRESPRFDLSCIEKMVDLCPNIVELGLAQIGPLDGKVLKPLYAFKNLRYLDVSDPGVSGPGVPAESLKDDDLIELLSHVGAPLQVLNVGGNVDLSDRFVLEGVLRYCQNLREVNVSKCEAIEGDALTILFDVFAARGDPGLEKLVLRRCIKTVDESLRAIVEHSGHSLLELDINSCDKLTGDSLTLIPRTVEADGSGRGCALLRKLDLGFVRATSDEIVTTLVDGVKTLTELKVFGDNKLSDFITSTPRCRIIGLEKQALIAKNVA